MLRRIQRRPPTKNNRHRNNNQQRYRRRSNLAPKKRHNIAILKLILKSLPHQNFEGFCAENLTLIFVLLINIANEQKKIIHSPQLSAFAVTALQYRLQAVDTFLTGVKPNADDIAGL